MRLTSEKRRVNTTESFITMPLFFTSKLKTEVFILIKWLIVIKFVLGITRLTNCIRYCTVNNVILQLSAVL